MTKNQNLDEVAKEIMDLLKTKNLSIADVCNVAERIKFVAIVNVIKARF